MKDDDGYFDGRMIAIESLWPTKRHWLLGSPYARRTPSPFLDLRTFPGWESLSPLLQENGEIEVEFDTLGRELKIFGVWGEYGMVWFEALKVAVEARGTGEAEEPIL